MLPYLNKRFGLGSFDWNNDHYQATEHYIADYYYYLNVAYESILKMWYTF